MVQSPSWEANWFAASEEIPRISRNPKVHYRTHKRPPTLSILGQLKPVHIPKSHLLEIHPNIIHPSTPRSPQWSPFLRFPHQDSIHPLSSPIRATCPAHLILLDFYHPHNIGWAVQIHILHFARPSPSLLQTVRFFNIAPRTKPPGYFANTTTQTQHVQYRFDVLNLIKVMFCASVCRSGFVSRYCVLHG